MGGFGSFAGAFFAMWILNEEIYLMHILGWRKSIEEWESFDGHILSRFHLIAHSVNSELLPPAG